jgi:AsmA protein
VLPFTIDNGLVTIKDSRLQSPLLRVQTLGTTDLVQEKLDLRVEPKFVGTIQGQGDNRQLAGIMVPVDIAGTFSNPKFQPDIGSIVQQIPEAKALQQDAQKELEKTQQKAKTEIEKKAQELFKGLPFGSNPLQTPKK